MGSPGAPRFCSSSFRPHSCAAPCVWTQGCVGDLPALHTRLTGSLAAFLRQLLQIFCKEIHLALGFPNITSLFWSKKSRHFYWGNCIRDFQFGAFLLLVVRPWRIFRPILICAAWLLLLLFIAKATFQNRRPLSALEGWQYSYLPNRSIYKADIFLRMVFEGFVSIYTFAQLCFLFRRRIDQGLISIR